jgi:hypothetical protein
VCALLSALVFFWAFLRLQMLRLGPLRAASGRGKNSMPFVGLQTKKKQKKKAWLHERESDAVDEC